MTRLCVSGRTFFLAESGLETSALRSRALAGTSCDGLCDLRLRVKRLPLGPGSQFFGVGEISIWEGRDLGVAFQAPPGSQASSRGEAKDSALPSSPDRYLLEPTERPKESQASCGVWPTPVFLLENPMDGEAW